MIPVNPEWAIADLNIGILYIFAISSLMVYGVIMAGWSSNSKYPFLASLRSAAQMVSYEVSIGFVFITVLLCAGSLDLNAIVDAQEGKYGLLNWFWLPLFPMFVVFFVSALAETNRPPFDWWRPNRTGRGLCGRVFGHAVPAILPRRIHRHFSPCARWPPCYSSAAGCRRSRGTVHLGSGTIWFTLRSVCSSSSCSPW